MDGFGNLGIFDVMDIDLGGVHSNGRVSLFFWVISDKLRHLEDDL